jgi:hypothetical protein
LAPLTAPDMSLFLQQTHPELTPDERTKLVAIADGSPGRAEALAEEGGLKLADMAGEVLAAGADISLIRAYQISDSLRDQAPFETFMGLLHRGVASAVSAYLRGAADPLQTKLIESKGPYAWAETAQKLAQIAFETEKANMDRRQALIAGLALFRGA